MTADLATLLERVMTASGPDTELDAVIAEAFGYRRLNEHVGADNKLVVRWHDGTHKCRINFTASIDTALGLVEKVLPGWGVQVGHPLRRSAGGIGNDDTGWYASVFRARANDEVLMGDGWLFSQSPQRDALKPGYRYLPNGALAILAALLKSQLPPMSDGRG